MRLIVLIAISTGMRSAEVQRLRWSDVMYDQELIAVRARLKRGKVRYVPMASELAEEIRRYPAIIGRIESFRQPGVTRVEDNGWREVLRTCSSGPHSRLLVP
jgi:integrase